LPADTFWTCQVAETCGIEVNHDRSLGVLALRNFCHDVVNARLVKFRRKIQAAYRHDIDPPFSSVRMSHRHLLAARISGVLLPQNATSLVVASAVLFAQIDPWVMN
ncbi:MAG: hypothetical protein ACRER6_09870, partial [Pseudomonas sp.]